MPDQVLLFLTPAPEPTTAPQSGVQVVRLIGSNCAIAAYRPDGTCAVMVAYDPSDVTPEDLVPFWREMEALHARMEARRPAATLARDRPAAG